MAFPGFRQQTGAPEEVTLELEVLVDTLDHPEGVAYGPDGKIYTGGEAGQIYRVSLEEKTYELFSSTGGWALGIASDAECNLYVCDMNRRAVIKVQPDGQTSVYSRGTKSQLMKLPNYLLFDAAGNMYVSDSGDRDKNDGLIYLVRPGGETEVWSRAVCGFTNGLPLSVDDRWLYVVETIPPQIVRLEIGSDGKPGRSEVVLRLHRTVPEGLAFDANGNLLICCTTNCIYNLIPGGELETLFEDWTCQGLNLPANMAFAGPDLDTLVVANLGGWSLTYAKLQIKGQPLHYPHL